MVVKIQGLVSCLVVGFNIYSIYGQPILRADYNDIDNVTTLSTGIYEFIFKIPAFTFSNGEYRVVFDVADLNVKNYATADTTLTFDVSVDKNHFGNIFNETNILKTSIIRSKWIQDYRKISDI